MKKNFQVWVIWSMAVTLFVFGSLLIWAIYPAGLVLNGPDAVFSVPNKYVLYLTAGLSFSLSGYCLLADFKESLIKSSLLSWLFGILLLYQIGTQWVNGSDLFVSLGNLNDRFPIPPRALSVIMMAIFSGCFSLSLISIVLEVLGRRKSLKMAILPMHAVQNV